LNNCTNSKPFISANKADSEKPPQPPKNTVIKLKVPPEYYESLRKRQKTDERAKTIPFDEVYQNGTASKKLKIFKWPKDPDPNSAIEQQWYILRYKQHDV
jgi:hypothetical protein